MDRPDSLLKSALEKIVFFECRIDQLTAELARATDEIDRLKRDLSQAAQRELTLKRELADEAAKATMMTRERDEAMRRVDLFMAERERFLGRLIESEQIRQAGGEDEGVDLAAFIAELRGEVMRLTAELAARQVAAAPESPQAQSQAPTASMAAADGLPPAPGSTSPPPQPAAGAGSHEGALPSSAVARVPQATPPALDDLTPAFHSTSEVAQALAAKGRIGVGAREIDALRQAASFQTRSEETLFALSLKELSSPDAPTRLRAAQRLRSMNPRAALPALASALHAEADPEVCKALIGAVADAGSLSVLPLLSAHLSSGNLELRLCALEAAFRLGARDSLARALEDDAPLVRRRAVVLASGSADQVEILERAIRDPDASVRRVAALGLGATASAGTLSAALLMALDDRDEGVRRAAARGLSARLGSEVHAVAALDPSRRRREVRRLATHRVPKTTPAASGETISRRLASISRTLREVEATAPTVPSTPIAVPSTPLPGAIRREPPPRAPPDRPAVMSADALAEAIVGRIYGALRGQSDVDLAEALALPREHVHQAAQALATSGRIVRRGQRYFVP